MKVINLFAGPSAGKSTTAAGLFFALKQRHVSCELVPEFAKVLAWEKNNHLRADQLYVTVKQNRGIERLIGQVEYAVVDSPLLLGIYYGKQYRLKNFDPLITELFHSYDNINFFVNRAKRFSADGRFHDEASSLEADRGIRQLLLDKNIAFHEVTGDETVVEQILEILKVSL